MEGLLIIYTGIALFAVSFLFWITKTKSGKNWVKNL